jgi:hypothetical protein
MDETPRMDTPSIRLHKRQVAWQILVPLIVAAVLIILAAVFVVTRGAASDRVAADISAMWLIMPVLIFMFIFLVIIGGLIYGTAMLTRILPKYSGRVQSFLVSVASGARKAADGSAKPFIWMDQAGAVVKSIFRKRK